MKFIHLLLTDYQYNRKKEWQEKTWMNFGQIKSRDAVRNTSYRKKTRYRFRQTYLKLSSLLLNRGSQQMQCSKCSTEDTYIFYLDSSFNFFTSYSGL